MRCGCGTSWSGMKIEHCPECHQTFTGTSAGDKHRTGDHAVSTGPDRRRCRTVEEMLEVWMTQNRRGVWTSGGSFWPTRNDLETPDSATVAHNPKEVA